MKGPAERQPDPGTGSDNRFTVVSRQPPEIPHNTLGVLRDPTTAKPLYLKLIPDLDLRDPGSLAVGFLARPHTGGVPAL